MSEDNVLKDLFSGEHSKRNLSAYLAVLIVILIYHASVFWIIMGDEIQSKGDISLFSLEFEEESIFSEESRTINDGESAEMEFSVQNEVFDSHSGFGLLYINISYTETSGEFADPCDTVSADLSPTGAKADWGNESNILSGMNSDCETISLKLFVYPSYNGVNNNVSGQDKQYWIDMWQDESHGKGIFTLEIEVIVDGPPTSPIPGVSDSDEEVTVTWEAVFFDVVVSEL